MGCSTEPVGRIGTRPFDTYVTMASTPGRWNEERSPLRWLEKWMCRRQHNERGYDVASAPT